MALIYELCYGWDFVPTELMFRGFLVIGMVRVLGHGAVLPMVVLCHSLRTAARRGYFVAVWRLFAGCTGIEYAEHLGWITHSYRHCLGYGNSRLFAGSQPVIHAV
jgi:hypothetical protein